MYESQNIGHFIGRAEEISIFERWLRDPEGPWILYVHDAIEDHEKKGGIGKTWLLRRYAELVQQQYPEIGIVQADFFNVADRDRVFLTQKVVAGLQRLYPSWAATLFNKAIQTRDIGEQFTNSMTTSAVREAVIDALSEDLRRLEAQLEEEQRMLLIFFDTFETIERNPTVAVLRQRQTFPDTYQLPHVRVVIAGRNQLDWNHINWRGRQSEIRALPLHPFSPQEMLLYIQNESFYDIPATSEQARALYARTEGRPIMIGLAIDVLNNRIQRLDELVSVSQSDFERYLVRQINKLENPLNWVILFMAHIYHSFNLPILDWILQRVQMNAEVKAVDPADLTRRLPRLSFVRRASANDNFTLHDEMRRLVVRYCWEDLDPDRRYRKSLSNSVISYFEEQLKGNITEQQRQTYIVEMLYHRLYIDPQDGFRFFQENITQAMRQSKTAFARLMVQEVQPFAELLSRDDRSDILLTEARITRYEKEASASLAFLNRLREEASAD
ncbi:MAG TPA: hypothetical protein VKX46_01485, partial [Ktedonobacteraceae bacterium]|nr:hypothetical protein [Ktedonobacteraceae bacterium]